MIRLCCEAQGSETGGMSTDSESYVDSPRKVDQAAKDYEVLSDPFCRAAREGCAAVGQMDGWLYALAISTGRSSSVWRL